MRSRTLTTNWACTARIDNNWPRPGSQDDSISGRTCVGRFLASHRRWAHLSSDGRTHSTGTGEPLAAIAAIFAQECHSGRAAIMFGYLAYEAGYAFVDLDRPRRQCDDWDVVPDLQFLLFGECEKSPATSAHRRQVTSPLAYDILRGAARSLTPRPDYRNHVARILNHIADGDIYQANYTQGFDLTSDSTAAENYASLCRSCPAAYNALMVFPELPSTLAPPLTQSIPEIAILSASPERFWRKTGDLIETRPIKGTIARGGTESDDHVHRRRLLGSRKDRAELLMITDLERNDLGKVARTGSVKTSMLARPRPTPSVWHLEATVSARLREGLSWVDTMKATFPGGSITGAPKRRAVEILGQLEPMARGVYCGAFGWVDAHGDADFAVAIRTAVQIGRRVRIFGGGGIVADSDPDAEYQESLVKIAPLIQAFATTAGDPSHPTTLPAEVSSA